MHMLMLVPAFLLFLLLGDQVLLPNQAYGWCCSAAICRYTPGCWCPGQYNCNSPTSDSDAFQANAQTGNGASTIEPVRELLPFAAIKPDLIERIRVMEVTRGSQCLRDRFVRTLLGSPEDVGQKFETVRFDEKNIQDKSLAFKMEADKEK